MLNQLLNITTKASGLTQVNISYAYATGQNNGKIAYQTDAITGESVSYAYDSLNRLTCAYGGASIFSNPSCSSTPSGATWGQGYQYDGFGNLTDKNVLTGSATTFHGSMDPATNHMVGQAYDANGNAQFARGSDVIL